MAGAGGIEVGRVSIRVVPDLDGFRRKVERQMRDVARKPLKYEGDFDDLDKELKKRTKDQDGGKIQYGTELDNKTLGTKAQIAAAAASRHKVHFRTKLDSSGVLRDAFLTARGIQNILSQNPWKFSGESLSLKRLIDVSGLDASLPRINKHLREMRSTLSALRGLKGTLRFSTRALGSFSAISKAARGMARSVYESVKVFPTLQHSLRGFISHANVAGAAMAMVSGSALLTKGTIVGVGYVLGYVVDGVKQLSGSLLLIPGLLGGVGMAGATVFAGFRGMGKALSAAVDESQDLEASIEGLAPSAQDFARSVREITPAWKEVAKQTQGTIFKGLGDQLRAISSQQLPTVSEGMRAVGKSTNLVLTKFSEFAKHERTSKALGKGFASTANIIDSMGNSTDYLMYALQDMGVVGLEALSDMSNSWPELARKFENWASSGANQEKMRGWIDSSIEGFRDLGKTVGNLYGSFKQIGNAFGVDFGHDAIARFENFTGRFRDWLGDADDADSRISKFAAKVEELAKPWQETASNAWDKLAPAAQELVPFLTSVSDETAKMVDNLVNNFAPKLEGLFSWMSDNKDWLAPLTAGLLGLRALLGVFKLGRMFISPFIGLATGAAKAIGSIGKGIKKTKNWLSPAARAERRASKAERKAAKDKLRSNQIIVDSDGKSSKSAKKTAKERAKASRRSARADARATRRQERNARKINRSARKTERISRRVARGGRLGRATAFGMRAADTVKNTKAVKGLGKATKGLGGAFKRVGPVASKGIGTIGKTAGTVGKTLTKMGPKAGRALGGVGKVAKVAGKGLARLVPGLGTALLVADAGMLIHDNWDKIGPVLGKAKNKAVELGKTAKDKLGSGWDKAKEKVSGWGDTVKEKLNGVRKRMEEDGKKYDTKEGGIKLPSWDDIKDKAEGLKQSAQDFFSNPSEWFSDTWNGLKEDWAEKWEGIKTTLGEKWDGIKEWASTKWEGVSESIGNAWDGVKDWWSGTWEGITSWLGEKWNGIKESASTTWTNASTTVGNAWDTVQDLWSIAWTIVSTWLSSKWETIRNNAVSLWSTASTWIGNAWEGVQTWWSTTWDTISTTLSEKWNTLKTTAQTTWDTAKTTVSTAWDGVSSWWGETWSGVSTTLGGWWDTIKGNASNTFSGVSSTVSGAWSTVQGTTSSTWGSVVSAVTGAMSSAFGAVSGGVANIISSIAGMVGPIISTAVSAFAGFVSAVAGGISNAVGIAASLPGRFVGAMGNLGGLLISSGVALVQGFISGIRSMIGAVASAASAVVQAARNFFPNSPAKRGPFSGHGYTPWSGKALVKDFAKGILSEKRSVEQAAGAVTAAAQKNFAAIPANPSKAVHKHHRDKLLKPVRENNAKAVARARKDREKEEERHQKRLAEIAKSGAKDKSAKVAEQEKKHSEKLAEIQKKLDEDFETADKRDIDTSFRSYWVEGVSEMVKDRLVKTVKDARLSGLMKQSALSAVETGRRVMGNNPLFARVEASVNSKSFDWAVTNAIEESEIHEIPVNLVVSNLDQLKSDLGLGDGVISRGIDAALDWNGNNSDSARFDEKDSKTEIHYHVEDMNEAIRMEKLRERKRMMKVK